MYRVNIVTLGEVNHPPREYKQWVAAFMDIADLSCYYRASLFTQPQTPTFAATVECNGATVAKYDNIGGWNFQT